MPQEDRLRIEREFKKTNGKVNYLVATPTLEMGVNIGALEMAVLREGLVATFTWQWPVEDRAVVDDLIFS